MISKIVEYEIHNGYTDFIDEAIREFLKSIKENEPDTQYQAFTYGDRKYIHMMSFNDEVSEEIHKNAAYTILFVEKLYPKCVHQPKFYDLTEF